jgi:hypothetical protein
VADAVIVAIKAASRTTVEEIVVTPSHGSL